MRKNIIVGNWKMNLNMDAGLHLVENILDKLQIEKNMEVVFAPSFIHLQEIAKICSDRTNVFVASQDCSIHDIGAFTGEVSSQMIASCNAKYVILGHSERRNNFSETNEILTLKVEQAFKHQLGVIFCCGESLDQRKSGMYFDWIEQQISDSLFHLSSEQFSEIIIAYEPIWAIGTGMTATPNQAQEIHVFIRNMISKKYGTEIAENTSILYGGSCNPSNVVELFAQKDIDGGLIGGASLKVDDFIFIINSV